MKGKFEQHSAKTGFFYIGSILKRFLCGKNIFAFLYMAMNYGITFYFFYAMEGSVQDGLIGASFFMFLSFFIALTPIGEGIFRLVNSFSWLDKDKAEEKQILDRLDGLFIEVVERTRAFDPSFYLDKRLKFYVKDDRRPSAYAVGRRTLCVTTGLLSCSDDEIKAALAHEIRHFMTRDSDLILFISSANLFLTTIAMVIKAAILFGQFVFSFILSIIGGDEGFLVSIISAIGNLLQLLCVNLILWIWTSIGVLMIKHSSKKAEYEADAFSCDLGYGEGLFTFFNYVLGYEGVMANSIGYDEPLLQNLKEKTSVFSILSRRHPATEKRRARVRERLSFIIDSDEDAV